MNKTFTGSDSVTITVGGPCARCAHDCDSHGVVCSSPPEHGGDDTPMCNECVWESDDLDEDGYHVAFHAYDPTPLHIPARLVEEEGEQK